MRQALYGLLHYHYQLGAARRKDGSRKERVGTGRRKGQEEKQENKEEVCLSQKGS